MNVVRLSENTMLILFEQHINQRVFSQVCHYRTTIEAQLSDYIIDLTPAYTSIHIAFNNTKISSTKFKSLLEAIAIDETALKNSQVSLIEIPVYYGPEVALDMEWLAKTAALTIEEVIHLHSDKVYDVYAIGFAPGFAYLGNVDPRIASPRKETPRQKIAKGSLGIADRQTAIYPSDSPGGWQIIGKTPLDMVDYNRQQLCQFMTGDKIQFIPISREEFIELGGKF